MIIRELFAKIGFKTDEKDVKSFNDKVEKSKKKLEQTGTQAEKSSRSIKKWGAVAAKAGKVAAKGFALASTAIIAVGAASVKAVASFTATADQFAKDSKKIGIGVEALQELSFAAKLSGSDFETVKKGFQRLSAGLFDAATKGTGPAVDALNELGISLDDPAVKGRDLEAVLGIVSDKFALMENGATKAALAQKFFGKAGAELIPLLNEGSAGLERMRQQARDTGVVFSAETAAAAEKLNDDTLRLTATLEGIKNEVLAELIPVFREVVVDIQEWTKGHEGLIKTRIKEFIRGVVKAAKLLAKVVGLVVDNWELLLALFATSKIKPVLAAVASGLRLIGVAATSSLGPLGLILTAMTAVAVGAGKLGAELGEQFREGGFLASALEKLDRINAASADARSAEIDAEIAESERQQLEFDARINAGLQEADKRIARNKQLIALGAFVGTQAGKKGGGFFGAAAAVGKNFLTGKGPKGKKRGRGGGGGKSKPDKDEETSIDDLVAGAFGPGGIGATSLRGTGPGTTINRIDASITNGPTSVTIEVPMGVLAGKSIEEQARVIGEIATDTIDKRNVISFDQQRTQILG